MNLTRNLVNPLLLGSSDRTCDCSNNLSKIMKRGEMFIELGYSWLTAKTMEVE